MDKLKMQSKNIVDENIEYIAERFPDVVVEVADNNGNIDKKIDFELLKQELSDDIADTEKEKYVLTWPGKNQSIMTANTPIEETLRPLKEKSSNFDSTKNLYMEGDNLDVLKLLRETYLGRVKVIYIDPPYNTGSDFIYNDNYAISTDEYLQESNQFNVEGQQMVRNIESNGRFHSDWLSMMYSRLRVARDLLCDDGLIFISIDDNEQANLTKICDEIFGEENRINTICVNMSNMSGPKIMHAINGKRFPKIKEYVLLYSKNKSQYHLAIPKALKESWDAEYNLIIPNMTEELFCSIGQSEEVNEKISGFKIFSLKQYMTTNGIEDKDDEWKKNNAFRIFASKPNTALLKLASTRNFPGELAVIKNPSGESKLIKTDFNRNTRTARIELVSAKENIEMYYGDQWGDIVTTGGVAQEGGVPFENGKKPLKLIKRIVKCATNNCDDIVMDFFSGSATTAQAVMQLNAEDGGHRRFIMVQIPVECSKDSEAYKAGYRNICEIGEERIRRAGNLIKNENPSVADSLDTGFRVLKLDSSNMKDVYYNPNEYTPDLFSSLEDNINEGRTNEDLLFQVMLDLGIMLDSKIEEKTISGKKIFVVTDEDKTLICCFDKDVTDDVVTEIAKSKPDYAVFRDSSMSSDSVAINFEQIFKTYSPSTTRKVL